MRIQIVLDDLDDVEVADAVDAFGGSVAPVAVESPAMRRYRVTRPWTTDLHAVEMAVAFLRRLGNDSTREQALDEIAAECTTEGNRT